MLRHPPRSRGTLRYPSPHRERPAVLRRAGLFLSQGLGREDRHDIAALERLHFPNRRRRRSSSQWRRAPRRLPPQNPHRVQPPRADLYPRPEIPVRGSASPGVEEAGAVYRSRDLSGWVPVAGIDGV